MTPHPVISALGRMRQEDQNSRPFKAYTLACCMIVYSIAQLEHNKFISCPISSWWHAIYKTLDKFTEINHDVTVQKACPQPESEGNEIASLLLPSLPLRIRNSSAFLSKGHENHFLGCMLLLNFTIKVCSRHLAVRKYLLMNFYLPPPGPFASFSVIMKSKAEGY